MTSLLKLKIWEKGTNQHVSLPDYRIDIEEGDSDMLRELIDAIRGGKSGMSDKKIKVYGMINEELEFKIRDEIGIIGTIFDNTHISSCILTFEDGMIMYARLCDNNIIGVHVVEKGEVGEGDKKDGKR